MSSMRVVFGLGEYVAELRMQRLSLNEFINKNTPWPENLQPGREYHRGRLREMDTAIASLAALVERADPEARGLR